MTIHLGKVRPGSTIYIPFDTFAGSTGASITMSGLAAGDIKIYKNGGTTERGSTTGFTLLDTDGIDFDSLTGIHGFSIDLSSNATADFFNAGAFYWVVVSTITVDSQTVSFVAATFSIGYEGALIDTTIATLSSQTSFTLTAGPAEDDALNGCLVVIHDIASAVQLGYGIVQDYTGSTKTVTLAAGVTFTAAAGDNISILSPALQPATWGRTLAIESDGMAHADVKEAAGTAWASGAITAAAIASDAITAAKIATGAIDADAIADGAIDAGAIAADAITAAKIADGAIDAATFAAGAINNAAMSIDGSELTAIPWNAAWDAEVQSEVDDALVAQNLDHLVKIAVDTDFATTVHLNSVIGHLADNGTSATFDRTTDSLEALQAEHDATQAELANGTYGLSALETLVDDLESRIGTPSNLGGGATIAANLADIEGQTDDIGAAGAGLTAVAWNAAWDAEVQSEVQDAIEANNLDHLVKIAVDTDFATTVHLNSVVGHMADNGTSATFDRTTDSLEALQAEHDTTQAELANGTYGLSAIETLVDDLESRIGAPANLGGGSTIAQNLADIEAQTDDIGTAGAGLTAVPWNASWDAEVQSEVADALEDTIADSTPADGSRPSVKQALLMLTRFMLEKSVSSTTVTVKKEDGSTTAFTLTLNSSTDPTSITRAS